METLTEIRATSAYSIRLAAPNDVPVLQELRREAAEWILETYGVEQWPDEYPEELFAEAIENNHTYMVDSVNHPTPVATITVSHKPDERKWSENARRDSAVYASKLMVARCCSGEDLGVELLDFAEKVGYERSVTWLRLDAWTTNDRLHEFYLYNGFDCLDVIESDQFASGAIFQRIVYQYCYIGTQLNGTEQFLSDV